MSFLLPTGLTNGASQALKRACVAGGPDNMPWPAEVRVEPGLLTIRREVDESGSLVVPWSIDQAGLLMGTTATLVERPVPYQLQVELARGKVNQVRCQTADWQVGGLQVSPALADQIRQASIAFSRAVTQPPSAQAGQAAQAALLQGYQAAELLVQQYTEQMFQARHQRLPRLETLLGCRLEAEALPKDKATSLLQACNSLCLAFSWKEVEPVESGYQWDAYEKLLKEAQARGLTVTGGPLIDFSAARLPDWLWLWERDLQSISAFMCEYVETVVKRYRQDIRCWQLTTASNSAAILGLGEEELLWLTVRLVEAARQVDPKLELVVGLSQPWGEYMAVEDRTYSPFIFADNLNRSGLNLAGLDLEVVMGSSGRGSYCRDLLEMSRMIDLYTLLGLPLRVTLGYPSQAGTDLQATPEWSAEAGHWHGDFSAQAQAEWTASFAGLALCKPAVRGLHWVHASDASPHLFPHCGLFDDQDQSKPALQRLRELRENHLR